ncbi:MAG: long-chain fatty acid--CoA ligase [Deltaproteobacteria bacterium]|nr:MAG: long-chain fatty acid--CoA ligase [Deltaproteobacteria bacterium]
MVASASFRSVAEMYLHRIASTPDSDAFTYDDGSGWRSMTWQEAGAQSREIAGGLLACGIRPGDRCAILSGTRVEWILVDMAILSAGAVMTALVPSTPPEECAWILADSGSRVVFTEHAEHTERVTGDRTRIPAVDLIVQVEPGGHASHELDGATADRVARGGFRPTDPPPVVTLAALRDRGQQWLDAHPGAWNRRAAAVGPEDLATLLYTSGTTGRPKGVELTHDAWVFEGEAIDALGIMTPADRQLLFLPLAHSFTHAMEIAAIRVGLHSVVDGRVDLLPSTMQQTRPSFMAGVPRTFEKLHNAIVERAHRAGPVGTRLFRRALAVGLEVSRRRQRGEPIPRRLRLAHQLAERTVFAPIRGRLGGRLRFLISGGAPLAPELAEFFDALGIRVLEGYGLTEAAAASLVNRPDRCRFGTVGLPLPGVEVRLAPTDGEILLRSRGVMRGYHGLPEDTAAVLDPDGWLHTGDIGELDADGFLRITDRKKDLIKTSTGKTVAPQRLEARLRAVSPLIGRALVHGDGRNFVSAILTLDPEQARGWAAAHDCAHLDHAALCRLPEIHAEIQAAIDRVASSLPPHERIRRFAIVDREPTVDDGELTGTLKLRRRAVEERYRQLLDSFYEGTISRL